MMRSIAIISLLVCSCCFLPANNAIAQYLPIDFCNGTVFPVSDQSNNSLQAFWDEILDMLYELFGCDLRSDITPLIENGRTPADEYGTSQFTVASGNPGCSATIVGPNTAVTAAHCVSSNVQFDGETMEFWHLGNISGTPGFFPTSVQIMPERAAGDVTFDIALIHFGRDSDDLPTPYVALYDYATQAVDCTAVLAQGFAGISGGLNLECESGVYGVQEPYLGVYCIDPLSTTPAGTSGGDSGGPLYAIVAGVPYLGGTVSGGGPGIEINDSRYVNVAEPAIAAWLAAYIENPPPFGTMANGARLDNFYFDVVPDAAPADNIASDVTVPCIMDVAATALPLTKVGCTIYNATTGKQQTCFDDTPVGDRWECLVTMPARSGDNWSLRYVQAFDSAGTRSQLSRGQMQAKIAVGFTQGILSIDNRALNLYHPLGVTESAFSVDNQPPSIDAYHASSAIAPNGTVTCVVTCPDQSESGVNSLIDTAGCVFDSAGYASRVVCDKSSALSAASSDAYHICEVQLPVDVTTSSVWTLTYAFARDAEYNSAVGLSGAAFTALDCSTISPTITANNGWSATQAIGAKRGDVLVEFYVRPTAVNIDAQVAFGNAAAFAAETDGSFAVRFNSTGFIDAWDGTDWCSTLATCDASIAYAANVWYHVRVVATATYLNSTNLTYRIDVSACGDPLQRLLTDGTYRYRMYDGISSWAAQSGTANNLDVSGMSIVDGFYCEPFIVQACAPQGKNCEIPDGCGGTPVNCGTCSGGTPTCGPDGVCVP